MLRRIFNAILDSLSEVYKPRELPPLPQQVTAALRARGYRQDMIAFTNPVGGSGSVIFRLQAPGGAYIGNPETPRDVQEQYIADAKAAYQQCGLAVPEVIPGTEITQASRPRAPHAG